MTRPHRMLMLLMTAVTVATQLVAAPVILTHPDGKAAYFGEAVALTVSATGSGPLRYQWRIWNNDGAGHRVATEISGGTSATLAIPSADFADIGAYSVMVSDSTGAAESRFAVLTVKPVIPPTLFDVTDYGAVADGSSDSGPAIQATIDAANAAGGGIVRVPAAPRPFVAGLLVLKSNVSLRVEAGAVLLALPYGSYQPEIYRQVVPPGGSPTPYSNWLSAEGATNIELSGGGTIDGYGGSGWWPAFIANPDMPHRPYLIKLNGCTNVYIHDLLLTNSPMFHLVPSACKNVMIDGLRIVARGDPPNTDGIDPSGENILIERCTIDVGDDDIVMKPQFTFCCNIHIRDNTIFGGHGISIGGQTNSGLDGMLVERCTMTGSDNGVRMKADPKEGGPVRNVTYRDITMVNVRYPIVFYSYYSKAGTPGNTAVPTVVSYNTAPPTDSKGYVYAYNTPTMPTWRDITIDGLTATGVTGGSIIWGNPVLGPVDAFVSGVRLHDVSLNGGVGANSQLRIYNAYDVQLSGSIAIAALTTCNALAIRGQPQDQLVLVGGRASFSVTTAGTSGGGPGGAITPQLSPSYRWCRDEIALNDGPQPSGSVLTGAATATLEIRNCQLGDTGSYAVVASNTLDAWDYSVASPALIGNSAEVRATSAAARLVVIEPRIPRRHLGRR